MRSRVLSPVSLVAALAAGSALAADPAATVRTARLTDNLYALTATTTNPAGSTLLALVGGDDILLVDTAYADSAEAVRDALRAISPAPIRYIVATHLHDDHIGGNELLAPGATVIAHHAVRTRLTTGLARLAPRPAYTLPIGTRYLISCIVTGTKYSRSSFLSD